MIVSTKIVCPAPIGEAEAGKHRDNVPALTLIPAITATGLPHGSFHLTVYMTRIALLGIGAHLNTFRVFPSHPIDTPHDIKHL